MRWHKRRPKPMSERELEEKRRDVQRHLDYAARKIASSEDVKAAQDAKTLAAKLVADAKARVSREQLAKLDAQMAEIRAKIAEKQRELDLTPEEIDFDSWSEREKNIWLAAAMDCSGWYGREGGGEMDGGKAKLRFRTINEAVARRAMKAMNLSEGDAVMAGETASGAKKYMIEQSGDTAKDIATRTMPYLAGKREQVQNMLKAFK